jgi:hypothetical protein
MATDISSTRNKVARIIGGANANNNFGGAITADYTNGPRNGLIDFTMSSGSGTISKVSLFMYVGSNYSGGSGSVDAHQLTRTNWLQTGVTFNKYDNVNSWTTPGGDYSGTIIKSVSTTTGTTGWMSWDLLGGTSTNPLSLTWGSDINLIMLANSAAQFDWDTVTNLPYIEITYTSGAINSGSFFFML